MVLDAALALAITATALSGLLAGASLDQSIKQLPARRRIGASAYAAYSRASDLGYGVPWYAALGLGAAGLTALAAVAAFVRGADVAQALPLYAAAALALLHSLATSRAAPLMFSQRRLTDEAALRATFDRFARWQALRAALQVLAFGAMLWALAATPR